MFWQVSVPSSWKEWECQLQKLQIIEFFTIGVSVRLPDRSSHREEQKKIVKNCPQWGLNAQPPDLQANALPTELSLNLHGLCKVMLY